MPWTPDFTSVLESVLRDVTPYTPGRVRGGSYADDQARPDTGQGVTADQSINDEMVHAATSGTLDQWLQKYGGQMTLQDFKNVANLIAEMTTKYAGLNDSQDAAQWDKAWADLGAAAAPRGYAIVNQDAASLSEVYQLLKKNNAPVADLNALQAANPDMTGAVPSGTVLVLGSGATAPRQVTAGKDGIPSTPREIADSMQVPLDVLMKGNGFTSPDQNVAGTTVTLPESPHRAEQTRVSPEQASGTPTYPYTQPGATTGNPSGAATPGGTATPPGSTATDPGMVDQNPNQRAYSEGGVNQLLDLLIGPKNYGSSYQRYLYQQAPLVDTVQQILNLVGGGAPTDDYANVLAGALGDYAGGKQYDNAGLSDVLKQFISGTADTNYELANGPDQSTNLLAALRSQGYSPMRMSTMFDDKVMAHLMNQYDATVANQPNAPSFIEWLVNSQGF